MADATKLDAARSREILARIAREAREAGLLRPARRGVAARACLGGAALAGLLWIAWTAESTATVLVAAAGAGLASIQLGFIAHDAGHSSVARGRRGNALAGQLAFSVVNGLGFGSWCESHNAHHAFCQDESQDPDMAVDVVMSLTPDSAARKTGLARWLLPYQGFTLWPLALLFAHSLRALQPIARRYCAAVGLPYHEEPPLRALVSVTRHVHRIARDSGASASPARR